MGRIRDDFECQLFNSMSEEVVDLFGVENAKLFRFAAPGVDNISNRDPLWDEPSPHVRYKTYGIKCMFLQWNDDPEPGPEGQHHMWENQIFISLNHLKKAGCVPDNQNDYVNEGDMIFVFNGRNEFYYDVIKSQREGWVNDSSDFTGYTLQVKRNLKFVPERKVQGA